MVQCLDANAAKNKSGTSTVPEVPDRVGGPSRTRTADPLNKSHFRQGSFAHHRPESAAITQLNRFFDPLSSAGWRHAWAGWCLPFRRLSVGKFLMVFPALSSAIRSS